MLTVILIFLASCIVTGNAQDFTVRLSNSFGYNSNEGRLEIFYSGRWGTVCDDGFTNANARVTCAMLGYGYVGAVISNRYGPGINSIWLDDVNCTGTESGIDQCAHRPWGQHDCTHSEDVSIHCDCGIKNLSGPTGQISSPNFPGQYANHLACYNYITVSSGETIIITFLAFNTEQNYDWVTITCESGSVFRSPQYSGIHVPTVLVISSCNLLNVSFCTDSSVTRTGFSLTYNFTSDNLTGGITTRPSNAPSRLDTDRIIFNCTSASEYLPWWTWESDNSIITNSTCGVITSVPRSSWFLAESLGPGSCNLIMVASDDYPYLLLGSLVCSDSTLSSATAIIPPIDCVIKNFTGPTGRISFPGFPLFYANNQRRCNYITAPVIQTIVITFLSFNVGYGDYVTITCENGNAYRSPSYSGIMFPAVLTISSCNLLNVYFHSNNSEYYSSNAFSLTFNMTSDIVISGFTTKPSHAFPRLHDLIIFNCTTKSKYFPWWTIDFKSWRYGPNVRITNSSCGVVTSAPDRSWFITEILAPGSCNLIVSAPANNLFRLAGVVTCTDSTLSSARAILAPVDPVLKKTKLHNLLATGNDAIRDNEIRISCNPSFAEEESSSPLVFTYLMFNGGLLVRIRMVRTYWTSKRNVVPSVYTSDISSYVLLPAPKDSALPRFTCNLVCDFFSNMTDLTANSTIEISFSTDVDGVFIVEYQNVSVVILLGVAVVALIIIVFILLIRICRQQANNLVADAGSGPTRRSNEYELQQRGGESNPYDAVFGTDVDVVGSDYYKLDAMGRRLPAIPQIYDELVHNDTGNEGLQSAESNRYEAVLGTDIDIHESEYDNIDDSPQRLPSLSGIYDELEFDK